MPEAIIKPSVAIEIVCEKINEIDKAGMVEMEERLDLVRLSERLVRLMQNNVEYVSLNKDEQDMLGISY